MTLVSKDEQGVESSIAAHKSGLGNMIFRQVAGLIDTFFIFSMSNRPVELKPNPFRFHKTCLKKYRLGLNLSNLYRLELLQIVLVLTCLNKCLFNSVQEALNLSENKQA